MIWFVNKILIWFIYCQNVCGLNVLKNLIWDGMLLIAKNMSNWGDFWSVGDQMKLTSYLREVNFLLIRS